MRPPWPKKPARTALWSDDQRRQPAVFALEEGHSGAGQGHAALGSRHGAVNGNLARETGARQTPDRAPFHACLSLAVTAAQGSIG